MVLFIAEDHGVIHWETLPEPMTRELFSAAIVRLRAKVDNNLTYKLIVDNLRSHKRLPAGTFQHPLVGVEYLPTYAPYLNPTEEAFNVLRSELIRQLDARRGAIIATKDLPRGQKTSARVSIVTECVTQSMPVLTAQKVQGSAPTQKPSCSNAPLSCRCKPEKDNPPISLVATPAQLGILV